MFPVKGWSVHADKLQTERPENKSAVARAAAAAADGEPVIKSKKRKRKPPTVDNSNVADLWESVIDGKMDATEGAKAKGQPKEKKSNKDKKRLAKMSEDQDQAEEGSEPREKKKTSHGANPSKTEGKVSSKDKNKAKKAKKAKAARELQDGNDDDPPPAKDTPTKAHKPSSSSQALAPSTAAPAQPKLTPLQSAMRDKLISARFRHLNETLYTRPSADALALFNDAPEMFADYHEGFRRQVEVWPENPVAGYIADIRARARARHPSKHHPRGHAAAAAAAQSQQQQQQQQPPPPPEPLPRSRDTHICTIADLGCGDARLAAALGPDAAALGLALLSFDLVAPHPRVTKADMADLPLASGSVDVAVLCLALMGTNWVAFVEEAYRVLRWKGELWVAETRSRFGAPAGGGGGGGGGRVVAHSVGRRRTGTAAGPAGPRAGGARGAGVGAGDETQLLVEVDGVDDMRQQTDVSAFVGVLNKRGFMLAGQDQGRGEEAVDLSNRMFVKMRFIKCAPATKGKNVREEKEVKSRLGGKLQTMPKRSKFIDHEVEVDEAAVLKPCVYKLR